MTAFNSPTAVSNLQIMRALLAKDWRLFRLPMIALVVVAVLCHGLGGAAAVSRYAGTGGARGVLFAASVYAAALTALLASAFGGVAIASERSDRTADFLALLPVTRTQIICSRWLVSAFMLGLCGVLHAVVAFAVVVSWHAEILLGMEWTTALAWWTGCTISFYGIAWLLSTFTRSATISACTSIGVTCVSAYLFAYSLHEHSYSDQQIQLYTASFTLALGFTTLIAGAIYYLKRIAS